MFTTRLTIKALDLSTWDAFAALVEANGGIFGGCGCTVFHPEEATHLEKQWTGCPTGGSPAARRPDSAGVARSASTAGSFAQVAPAAV